MKKTIVLICLFHLIIFAETSESNTGKVQTIKLVNQKLKFLKDAMSLASNTQAEYIKALENYKPSALMEAAYDSLLKYNDIKDQTKLKKLYYKKSVQQLSIKYKVEYLEKLIYALRANIDEELLGFFRSNIPVIHSELNIRDNQTFLDKLKKEYDTILDKSKKKVSIYPIYEKHGIDIFHAYASTKKAVKCRSKIDSVMNIIALLENKQKKLKQYTRTGADLFTIVENYNSEIDAMTTKINTSIADLNRLNRAIKNNISNTRTSIDLDGINSTNNKESIRREKIIIKKKKEVLKKLGVAQ